MEIGLTTFAETTPDAAGRPMATPAARLREVVEEAVLADSLGLDVYAIGEHHRPDFVSSAPAVVLAAIAARTERIRLSSAVSVLSSDDPVRVFQQFATLDLLSGGRAEIMAGRGSFIESFPLFGFDLGDYDELFGEKLELLLAIRERERVTWSGRYRAPLEQAGIYPRPVQTPLPVWVAVGGTPASVVRAATLGLPLTLAIIGGRPERFVPLVRLYREACKRVGVGELPLAVNVHGFVADTPEAAVSAFYGPYAQAMTRIGRERGWPPMTRASFETMRGPSGALAVGGPAEVAQKLRRIRDMLGAQRLLVHLSVGTVAHATVMRSIELLGTGVAGALRDEPAAPAAG
jgi:probable LLM family oxidoreductase